MKRAGFLLGALALSVCTAACTVGPNFTPPAGPGVASYMADGDAALPADQQLALGQTIEGDWWAAFHSQALNDVIALSLSNNQDIEAAKDRIAQAEEEVNAAEGALLPQVTLDAIAGRQKYGKSLFGPLDISVPPFTYYTVGPAVDVPLDIFGGGKRAVEQQQALREYQHDAFNAAYQSLTAHVAAEALSLAEASAQIEILNTIIADDQRNIALVQGAITAGSGTRVELVSAESQLATDRTLLPDLKQSAAAARHALAVLAGKAPAEWSPPAFTLDDFTLPGEIPASLPSELAHRRPDIMAAEAQLHAASAAIGVATAALYPKVDITGTLTQQALTPGGLFDSVNNAWSIAANLAAPIYDGGTLDAQRRAAIDAYKASLATYRQSIVTAFGDIADRMQALANDADRLRDQTEAADSATQALDLARRSYQAGNSGILDVIDAERRYSQAQLGLARAKASRLLDTAELFLALGGSPTPPPELPDTTKPSVFPPLAATAN